MHGLINLIVPIVVVCLIIWLVIYAIDYIGVGEPFSKIIKVVLMVFGILFIIKLLLPLIV